MTDRIPASQRESHNRRNQLPAGVTMMHLKYRIAALRIRTGGAIALRTDRHGPWDPVQIVSVGRSLRPWVIKIGLVDGTHLYLRPCLPGEAAITECGRSIGGLADTAKLGDDPGFRRDRRPRNCLLCVGLAVLPCCQLAPCPTRGPFACRTLSGLTASGPRHRFRRKGFRRPGSQRMGRERMGRERCPRRTWGGSVTRPAGGAHTQ